MKDLASEADVENGGSFNEEQLKRYDEWDAEREELESKEQTMLRCDKIKSLTAKRSETFGSPGIVVKNRPTKQDYDNSFRAFVLHGTKHQQDSFRRSADQVDVDYTANQWIVRAQSSDVSGEGGETVQDSIYQGVVHALESFGGVASVARTVRTNDAVPLKFATTDNTSRGGAWRANQNAAAISNTSATFSTATISAHTLASSTYPISYELIQDSSEDVLRLVGEIIGEGLARERSNAYVNGTGAGDNEPRGILLDASSAVTPITNQLAPENFHDLYFSVDELYRNSPSCAWVMHDDTLNFLLSGATMLDSDGRPLLYHSGNSLRDAPAGTILGKRVIIDNSMPVMGTFAAQGDHVVAFGDWSKFILRTVGDINIERDTTFARQLATGLFGWTRTDSLLVDAGGGAIKLMSTGVVSGDSA